MVDEHTVFVWKIFADFVDKRAPGKKKTTLDCFKFPNLDQNYSSKIIILKPDSIIRVSDLN